eukprot:jgi/Tetstr1/445915/TSEL_033544.t1
MPDGEEPVVGPTLESLHAELRGLATAMTQLTARERVVDGEGAHGSGSGQRIAGRPTGSGGAAECPDLLELAQGGRVGAKSVSDEDDYLALQVADVDEGVAVDAGVAAKMFKSYAGRLSQFAEFCHDSENISPLEATTATVVRYVAWIAYRFVTKAELIVSAPTPEYQHDFRALVASVVNFMFFTRGLTSVSCRVRDVHVDDYNITLQVYREKGRAGRRGRDDLRVLLLPLAEHPRDALAFGQEGS